MMKRLNVFLLAIILLFSLSLTNTVDGSLTITVHKENPLLEGSTYILKPASFSTCRVSMSSPVHIVKANQFDGCSNYPLLDLDNEQTPLFVLVDGRGCAYRKKAQYAKQAGARGIIIIDDGLSQKNAEFQQYSDGSFLVFLISNQLNGDQLGKQFYARINVKKIDISNVNSDAQLWVSSLNSDSYRMIDEFNYALNKVPKMKEKLTWVPKIVFNGCRGTSCQKNQSVASCACGTLFCSPYQYRNTPDMLVKEDIRQKIIFQQYRDKYFLYISTFKNQCFKEYQQVLEIENCAERVINKLSINSTLVRAKLYSFLQSCAGPLFQDLMNDKSGFLVQSGQYPILRLDKSIIEYHDADDLVSKLCSRMKMQQEEGCKHKSFILIIIIVLTFLLFLGVVVFLFLRLRRKVTNDIDREIQMRVEVAVEQYYTLNQQP